MHHHWQARLSVQFVIVYGVGVGSGHCSAADLQANNSTGHAVPTIPVSLIIGPTPHRPYRMVRYWPLYCSAPLALFWLPWLCDCTFVTRHITRLVSQLSRSQHQFALFKRCVPQLTTQCRIADNWVRKDCILVLRATFQTTPAQSIQSFH